MSETTYPGLKPLLMPSGPQWSEKWTDREPPALVHYDWHHYHVSWRESVVDSVREWPDGAWVCEPDRPPLWVRVLQRLGRYVSPGSYGSAREYREYCKDGKCVSMGWRFATGPDLKPWEPGDGYVDGYAPISIAVFGHEEVVAADAVHTAAMRGALGR